MKGERAGKGMGLKSMRDSLSALRTFRIQFLRMEVQRHVQCNLYIYMYHMYFGSRIKRLEKVRFPFRRYAAYGPSVIASNFAD